LVFIFSRLKINHDSHEFILESEEVRVRLMETNRDKLVSLADKVEKQAAEDTEPRPLIELGEEIEYRRDNVASIASILKGNVYEFKERALRALDESVKRQRWGSRCWTPSGRGLSFIVLIQRPAVIEEGPLREAERLSLEAVLLLAIRVSRQETPCLGQSRLE
jgi:hypothetical protein